MGIVTDTTKTSGGNSINGLSRDPGGDGGSANGFKGTSTGNSDPNGSGDGFLGRLIDSRSGRGAPPNRGGIRGTMGGDAPDRGGFLPGVSMRGYPEGYVPHDGGGQLFPSTRGTRAGTGGGLSDDDGDSPDDTPGTGTPGTGDVSYVPPAYLGLPIDFENYGMNPEHRFWGPGTPPPVTPPVTPPVVPPGSRPPRPARPPRPLPLVDGPEPEPQLPPGTPPVPQVQPPEPTYQFPTRSGRPPPRTMQQPYFGSRIGSRGAPPPASGVSSYFSDPVRPLPPRWPE